MTEVWLLGPMQLRTGGRVLEIGPPKRRAVFAALVVDAGRPVPVDTLVDRVWDTAPPAEARAAVYAHITRLRRVLAQAASDNGRPARLTHHGGAYLLDIDRDRVDLHRFRRLVEQARDRPDDEQSMLLGEALALWRGVPFAGLSGAWVGRLRDSCHRQRLDAVVAWARIELRRDNPERVVGHIRDLAEEYPLAEPLTAVLMRALYATGHAAEALHRFAALRQRLAEDLGASPAPELQELHRAILRNNLKSLPPPAAPQPTPAVREIPAQLPTDVAGFTGRASELAQLDAILVKRREQPTSVAICALSGTAGVGKTALAVHWAHRVADQFPDGQLYVNLRGFDPNGPAVNPAEVIRGFLDAFGVRPESVPGSLDAQAAQYRSLLAGRRVLVVLDNARDADQVRPLLPGSPGCLVVVTSRDQLTSLVAVEGAHPLMLDLLAPAEARDLLARRLGSHRVAAEPHAANEIAVLCARLPLTLAIVAARGATHPAFPLSALADELRDTRGRLNAFDEGDPAAGVRAVFSWSYHTLSSEAARLFRLLGLHPGPDIAVPAAASLAGASEGQVRSLLAKLARAHLVTEHSPGRYTFHDLLRVYAAELAYAHDTEEERHAANRRMLDHCLHTAHAADRLLRPHQMPISLAAPYGKLTRENLADHQQALAWFSTEHAVLLAAIDKAAATGFHTHAWQLAWTLTEFFDRRGHLHDWAASQQTALEAARQLPDLSGRAHAHRDLGRAYAQLGRLADAYRHLHRAAELFKKAGDSVYQAHTHHSLGGVLDRQGRPLEALHHARQALDLFQASGDKAGQASAISAVGWYHVHLGQLHEAADYCREALTIQQGVGDRRGQAATWHNLGDAHRLLGRHSQAIKCYQQCIDLYSNLGDRYYKAIVLNDLGDTYQAMQNPRAARDAWRRALGILQELDHHHADHVRVKLSSATDAG